MSCYKQKNPVLFLMESSTSSKVDGVAMCSPLGQSLANAFLVYFKKT